MAPQRVCAPMSSGHLTWSYCYQTEQVAEAPSAMRILQMIALNISQTHQVAEISLINGTWTALTSIPMRVTSDMDAASLCDGFNTHHNRTLRCRWEGHPRHQQSLTLAEVGGQSAMQLPAGQRAMKDTFPKRRQTRLCRAAPGAVAANARVCGGDLHQQQPQLDRPHDAAATEWKLCDR